MSWQIHTHRLPRIRSCAEAKKIFDEKKPWRGGDESIRPLEARHSKHKHIREAGGSYQIVLFTTPMVSYHADGAVSFRLYDSISSYKFLDQFTPDGCQAVWHRGELWLKVTTGPFKHIYFSNSSVDLKPAETPGCWIPLTAPAKHTQKVLNPQRAAQTRKQLKPFLMWRSITHRLAPGSISQTFPDTRWFFGNDMSNPENFYVLGDITPNHLRVDAYEHFKAYDTMVLPPDQLPRKVR